MREGTDVWVNGGMAAGGHIRMSPAAVQVWVQGRRALLCCCAAGCGKQARGRLPLQSCTPAGPALQAFTSVQLYIDSLLSYGALRQARIVFHRAGGRAVRAGGRAGRQARRVTLCLITSHSSTPPMRRQ